MGVVARGRVRVANLIVRDLVQVPTRPRIGGVHEDDSGDEFRMVSRDGDRDRPAHRVAGDDGRALLA